MTILLQIEKIVDGQLDAYNVGDFPAFASFYHEHIVSYDLETGELNPQMSGNHFFAHYKKKFTDHPNLFCRVTQRIVYANLVVDKEIIVNHRQEEYEELVIYQVDDGKISKMWFKS